MTRSSVLLSRLWFALVVLRFVGSAAGDRRQSGRLHPHTVSGHSQSHHNACDQRRPDVAHGRSGAGSGGSIRRGYPGHIVHGASDQRTRAERDGDLGYTRRGLLPFRRSLRAETGHALSLSGRERGRMDGVEPGPDRPNGSGSVYLRLLRRPPGWLEGTRHSNLPDRRPARAGRRLLADRGRSDLRTRGRPDPRLLHRRRCRLPQPPRGAGCRQPRHRLSLRRSRQHRSQQEGQKAAGRGTAAHLARPIHPAGEWGRGARGVQLPPRLPGSAADRAEQQCPAGRPGRLAGATTRHPSESLDDRLFPPPALFGRPGSRRSHDS
jgi:hypothetical protein